MSALYCDKCNSHFCLHVRAAYAFREQLGIEKQLKTENAQLRIEVSTLKQQVARDTGRLLNLRATCKRLRERFVMQNEAIERLNEQLASQIDENDALRGVNTFWGGKTECQRERDQLKLEVEELRKQVAGQVSFVSTEAADELHAENTDLKSQLDFACQWLAQCLQYDIERTRKAVAAYAHTKQNFGGALKELSKR